MVVQNAANSGVGRWVIAFAKTRVLKTVNIVRRPQLVAELEAIGGDVVVVDSPEVSQRIKAAVNFANHRRQKEQSWGGLPRKHRQRAF
jgi:NADPH:quinone reductase-like Zn-dependent oxidoreductase